MRESLGLEYLCCLASQAGHTTLADQAKSLWDEYEEESSHISRIVNQIDQLEALQQAYIYSARYPEHDLSDFKAHRHSMSDPWIVQEADKILEKWSVLESRTKADLAIVFVIGPPGVGKGTQCALAAKDSGLEHVSVGDLLRAELDNPVSPFKNFLRRSFQEAIAVPASLTMQLLETRLLGAKERGTAGVLIDGFPRSLEQLYAFEEQVCKPFLLIIWQISYLNRSRLNIRPFFWIVLMRYYVNGLRAAQNLQGETTTMLQ